MEDGSIEIVSPHVTVVCSKSIAFFHILTVRLKKSGVMACIFSTDCQSMSDLEKPHWILLYETLKGPSAMDSNLLSCKVSSIFHGDPQ